MHFYVNYVIISLIFCDHLQFFYMLIEFSVANFRSFRLRQTFTMVAEPRLHKRNNVFKAGLIGEKKFPDLLKVAVIYGPNASGKSNLLMAMNAISQLAMRAPSDSNAPLPVMPFGFDTDLTDKPSEFEIHFINEGIRYQFEISATAERISNERLISFPQGRETLLYHRKHTSDGDKYEFGEQLQGGDDLFETWRKLTPKDVLFIGQAVANSNEELTQLRGPFIWLKQGLRFVLNGMNGFASLAQKLAEKEDYAVEIASFLRDVDVPILRIKIEPSKVIETIAEEVEGENITNSQSTSSVSKNMRTILTHRTALGEADISFRNQSEGTKNLIGFWLPWFVKDLKKSPSKVLIVDELDSSLHPMIVTALVAKHIGSEIASQLIFTTHDTHLMDSKLLRRDQLWITERDMNGATQLRSIHEFEGREGEDIEKRYFEGRYRGLPLLKVN